MNSQLALTNGTVFAETTTIDNGTVVIENGKIKNVGSSNKIDLAADVKIIDVNGGLICPGFIDIHCNGGGGVLAMDGTYEAVCQMAQAHAKYGTTSLLPTTVAWSDEEQLNAIKAIVEAIRKGTKGAKPIGIHMEGPFLNPAKGGAHNPKYLVEPSISKFDEFYEASEGFIKMVTMSPELPGAMQLIEYLANKGIIVSAGHTDATYEQALDAIDHGVQFCTHIFNAMSGIVARNPGLVTAMLGDPSIKVAIITDGVHVHPSLVNLILQLKGTDNVVLVTDSTPASATNDTSWGFGGVTIQIKGFTGYLENGTIAGTSLTMLSALKIAMEMTNLPLKDALYMASKNPADLLGATSKGTIAPGMDADIVVLSNEEDMDVELTIVDGEIVYQQ